MEWGGAEGNARSAHAAGLTAPPKSKPSRGQNQPEVAMPQHRRHKELGSQVQGGFGMSVSSTPAPMPAVSDRLDAIAADLEKELNSHLHWLESEIEDARQLMEVAALLADEKRGAQLQEELLALQTRQEALLRAAQILRSRHAAASASKTASATVPISLRIQNDLTNGGAPSSLHSRMPSSPVPPCAVVTPPDDQGASSVALDSGSEACEVRVVLPYLPTSETSSQVAAAPSPWTPRPLSILEEERESIKNAIAGFTRSDAADLARFKAQASRFRGASDERKRHPGSQEEWRALESTLRDTQRALWPGQYCIPLDSNMHLSPSRWQELALLYTNLATAVEALDWIEATLLARSPHWLAREAVPLLEAIGAATALLFRWLRRHLVGAHDDQQDELYWRLRRLGREHEQFIRSLQPEELVPDQELESLVQNLPDRLRSLQEIQARKAAQETALAGLFALVREEGFGGREEDDDRLCEAAAGCLEAGIPPTDRALRDGLLDYHWMLEDDERLSRLHQAVLEEIERRRRKAEEEEEARGSRTDRLEGLTPQLREQLAALLPRTRGKVGVMLGGTCREDNRRLIEKVFELSELRWPDSDPSDPFERSAREIARAEIVFLTRFNRQRSKEAISVCRDQGKELIRLPGGYGLNQVIAQAYQQMFGRSGKGG